MRTRAGQGMTLLELLITLAIVALLAGLAVPGYTEYLQRARRQDAIHSLLRLHVLQEKWRAGDRDYATLGELGWTTGNSADGYYRLRVEARTPAMFRITAAPLPGGPQRDDDCGIFAVNQDGPLFAGGYAGRSCWQR